MECSLMKWFRRVLISTQWPLPQVLPLTTSWIFFSALVWVYCTNKPAVKKMWDWRGGQRIRTYIILRGVCPLVKCRYVVSVFQRDWDVFAHKTVLPGWVTGEYYFILQHLWWLGWCHICYSLYTTSEKNVTLHIIEVKKTNFWNNGNMVIY